MILLRLRGTEPSRIPVVEEQSFLPVLIYGGAPTIGGKPAEVGVVVKARGPVIEPSLVMIGVEV